jgi:hypothetical protein
MPGPMSVLYDAAEQKIHISVFIDSQMNILTPPVAVPAGDWNLCWEIDEGSMDFANFHPRGVEKVDPDMVPMAELELLDASGGFCRAQLSNRVPHTNGFPVYLFFMPPNGNNKVFKHDPTIAVTKDPMDPPTGPPLRRCES